MDTITATITVPTTSLTDARKAELLRYADALVITYDSEGYDLLKLLAEASKLELLAARIKEKAKEIAINEVHRYGKKGIAKLGVSMTIAEVGVSYDYSQDPVWSRLNDAVKVATAFRKQQEELLKALPYEGRIMMDEETGEEYRAYPPAKSGSDGVILKIN